MSIRDTGTILDEIVAKKAVRLALQKERIPFKNMCAQAKSAPESRDFRAAIGGKTGISLIAEIKKASPSRGLLRKDFAPDELARSYEAAGAAAISVITEQDFFLGSSEYLTAVRSSISIPILRKDFIISPYQIYESRAIGADALLLIAAILENTELADFASVTLECGMTPLVEVHNETELEQALNSGADVIGVNNRNLKTMHVDLSTATRLAALVPKEKVLVVESGIRSREDMEHFGSLGADAALVGETIVASPDAGDRIRELLGKDR